MLSHDCSINATETQWVKILFEGAFLLISIFFRKNLNPAREGFRLWNSFVVWWISKVRMGPKSFSSYGSTYRKVTNSRLSRLVAHFWIFRLFMKGKFDAYVLWSLAKGVQNWIVDRSTARDFTVDMFHSTIDELPGHRGPRGITLTKIFLSIFSFESKNRTVM